MITPAYTSTDQACLPDALMACRSEFLIRVQTCILLHLEAESFGVEALADAIFISRSQLFRKIKALTGRSVARFIHQVRVREVRRLLACTNLSAIDIADRTGFADVSYLRRVFFRETGQTLAQYRRERIIDAGL